jgi:organic hydroperoxide reductase OsmC/OhrA
MKEHTYRLEMTWTGNDGRGTADYKAYRRDHEISAPGKPVLPGCSGPGFRGDPSRYNPEELLVASLSSCHMLWVLHLCATAGVVVEAYQDSPVGVMRENPDGSGEFVDVELRPEVTIAAGSDLQKLEEIHHEAHHKCFIARSVNFPVRVTPQNVKVDAIR